MPHRQSKKTPEKSRDVQDDADDVEDVDLTQEEEQVKTPNSQGRRSTRSSKVHESSSSSKDNLQIEVSTTNDSEERGSQVTASAKKSNKKSAKQENQISESSQAVVENDDTDDNNGAENDPSTPTKPASQRSSARAHNPVPIYTTPAIGALKQTANLADESPSQKKRKPTGRPPRPAKRTLNVSLSSSQKKSDESAAKKDSHDSDDEDSAFELFSAIKKGTCSTQDLLREWRSRFEKNADDAARELINFIMNACGSKVICVEEHDDLDDLDMSSFVESVVQSLQTSKELSYPIASRAKVLRKFKDNFAEFWRSFIDECWDSELIHTTDIVEKCIDWLTSLSSSEVRAIRHTATFAAYEIGCALVDRARQLRDQLVPINRQCAAATPESNKKTTPKSKSKNPKLARLMELKDTYDEQLANTMTYISSLFNGIVFHRYRDTMPELRVLTVEILGKWIGALREDFLVDNYLKYLGWMLNDKSAKVRHAVADALQDLYEHEENAEKLELFTSRFLRRYLEMCDDVDDGVVLSIVELIAKIDRLNLLDDQSDLSVVERLVFYAGDLNIRRAAAEFVCLQYDAFGVSDQDMTEKQLVTQAVALIEFAEEYLGGDIESVDLLVSAFWQNEDCQVLQDWRLLTMLLGSDTHEPALSNEQQTILIRLLTGVIKQIVTTENGADTQQAKKRRKKDDAEPMTIFFCREIPPLMLRFQSEPEKLCLLLQLVSTLNWNATIMNQHKKHVEDLLARLKHAYLTHSDERFIQELSCCIDHMMESTNTALTREVSVLETEIFRECLDQCQTMLEQEKAAKTKDNEFALQAWLTRLHFLSGFINIKEEGSGRIDLAGLLSSFVRGRCTMDLSGVQLSSSCVRHAIQILFKDFLWSSEPMFAAMKESPQSEVPSDIVDEIVSKRENIESLLLQLLSIHLSERVTRRTPKDQVLEIPELELTNEQVEYVNVLQKTAFLVLGDLRCLCIQRFEEAIEPFKILAFRPHKNLVMLSQSYYERTMENIETKDEDKENLLAALASTSMCNPENKTQGAAVLQQMTSPSFQPIIKAFGKRMCSFSVVKYLEIQMMTLQQTFEESPDLAINMAKVLNQTLGVKFPASLRGSFLKFMAEGLRYSFEAPANGSFLLAMKPYLHRLDKIGTKSLRGHFEKLRSSVDGQDFDDAVSEFEAFFNRGQQAPHQEPTDNSQSSQIGTTAGEKRSDVKEINGGPARRSRNLSDDEDEPSTAPGTPPPENFLRPSTSKKQGRVKRDSALGDDDDYNSGSLSKTERRYSRSTRSTRASQESDKDDELAKPSSSEASKERLSRLAERETDEADANDEVQNDDSSPKRKSIEGSDDEVVGFRTKRRRH
ncbi:hypothetical protein LEN26_015333 [Aphanomyces euteiches]|nr:hypothetical protein LEN26_015333 [Aphanomyces euteiches]